MHRWPLLFVLAACGGDNPVNPLPDTPSPTCNPDVAPANLNGKSVTFSETGGVTNTWMFGAAVGTSGMATLVGTGDFPFTFVKPAGCQTTLTFDVSGNDVYEMEWTASAQGTCTEQFDGGTVNTCTFTVL